MTGQMPRPPDPVRMTGEVTGSGEYPVSLKNSMTLPIGTA